MSKQIKCKTCAKKIGINQAIASRSGGFECQECVNKQLYLLIIPAVLMIPVIILLAVYR